MPPSPGAHLFLKAPPLPSQGGWYFRSCECCRSDRGPEREVCVQSHTQQGEVCGPRAAAHRPPQPPPGAQTPRWRRQEGQRIGLTQASGDQHKQPGHEAAGGNVAPHVSWGHKEGEVRSLPSEPLLHLPTPAVPGGIGLGRREGINSRGGEAGVGKKRGSASLGFVSSRAGYSSAAWGWGQGQRCVCPHGAGCTAERARE